jgi:DNA polymerase delta subunit 1
MELFVYSWFYTGHNVYGHCLRDDGEYALLTVRGFYPSCYIEGSRVPPSQVAPLRVQCAKMATSRDVSLQKPFCKLYFRNMKDMDAFLSEAYVKRYMADVPQISVFLSQVGADHVGWVRVPHTECKPGDIASLPDRIPYSRPRVLAFDIEVKSQGTGMPQPHRIGDSVQMISVVVFESGSGSEATKVYILHTHDRPMNIGAKDLVYSCEVDMIAGFFRLIEDEGATVITGFNIFGFDMQYLVSRLRLRLLEIPDVSRGIKNSVDIIRVDWASDAYGHNQYDRLVIGGRLIVDMFLYFKRMRLDRYSLEFVSNKFLGEGKKGMPYERMRGAFHSRDHAVLREVAEYCVQDSVLVMNLFERVKMWIDLCEMSKITRCNIEDVYTRGEQMKLVSQCVRECISRNIVLQPQVGPEWKEYEGAYVIDPERGVYEGCCTLDFQSLYPSIIIAFNICPSTYCRPDNDSVVVGEHGFRRSPVGLLPGMIRSILEERKAVKALMQSCSKGSIEHVVLDRRQNALKVCANSVYGLMGFEKSRYFGHVGCAESVTTVGRQLLAHIVEYIKDRYPVEVIYGDTDSCMLWHRSGAASRDTMEGLGSAICNDVTAILPDPMALKFESYYDKVVLLTKKRYILVDGGSITYKGVMNARRDYCRFAKDTYEGVIGMVVAGSDGDSIKEYIDSRMEMLLYAECNIEDVTITKSISKTLNAYKVNQPHVVFARRLASKGVDIKAGTRLEYVYVNTEDRIVTPEEATEGRLPLDSEFYIGKQIATQVDDILSIVGLGCYIRNEWLPVCSALKGVWFSVCTSGHAAIGGPQRSSVNT